MEPSLIIWVLSNHIPWQVFDRCDREAHVEEGVGNSTPLPLGPAHRPYNFNHPRPEPGVLFPLFPLLRISLTALNRVPRPRSLIFAFVAEHAPILPFNLFRVKRDNVSADEVEVSVRALIGERKERQCLGEMRREAGLRVCDE